MDIDITSVVIGIASLATFAVPIGYDQIKVKRFRRNAERNFEKASSDLGFTRGSFDVLQNGAAIGIGLNNEELLYAKSDSNYQLIELNRVTTCRSYKNETAVTGNDGHQQVHKEMGIKVHIRNSEDVKLPVFQGRDGFQRGDESMIIERWMSNIIKASRSASQTNKPSA